MTGPKISVVIPVYNAEKTLAACVDSVLAQSYHNLQVVLSDDGSTDGSLALCKSYAERDGRVVVAAGENRGVSAARNRGLALCEGEFFAFVDSDDALFPDAYEKMLSAALGHSLDLVFCKVCRVSGGKAEYRAKGRHQQDVLLGLNVSDACNDSMEGGIWSALYRASAFGDLRFDERLRFGEDVIYFMDCFARRPRAMLLDGFLYRYAATDFAEKYYGEDYPEQCQLLCEMCKMRLLAAGESECAAAECFHQYYKAAFALAADRERLSARRAWLNGFAEENNSRAGMRVYLKLTLRGQPLLYRAEKRLSAWLLHGKHFALFCFLLRLRRRPEKKEKRL